MKKYGFVKTVATIINLFLLVGVHAAGLTSQQALQKLKDGNERFVTQSREYKNLDKARLTSTSENGQYPFATIIGCSDSRVPIEHIFDVGVGDVFVIRVAGNVCDIDESGSIEYGVDHLKTPLLVVLGHTGCGAVTAVARGDEVHGNIPVLVDNIIPAVDKAKAKYGDHFSDELLSAAIKLNVWQSIEDLLKNSPITAELVKEGSLEIVGAVYNLSTGKVEWLGEHPQQKSLLASAVAVHTQESESTDQSEYETVKNTRTNTLEAKVANTVEQKSGSRRTILIMLVIFAVLVYFLLLNKKTALKLKLRGRIMSISVVFLILLAGSGMVSYIYTSLIGKELVSIAQKDIPLSGFVTNMETHQLEQSIVIERILKNMHNSSLSSGESQRIIKNLEDQFTEISHMADQELAEAEGLCKTGIGDTKESDKVKEFQDVLNSLKKIDKEHMDFENQAKELFGVIGGKNLRQVAEYEALIEKEVTQINYEIDSLLQAINQSTANSVAASETHEQNAVTMNIILLITALFIGLVLSFIMINLIVTPIKKTVELVTDIADGDLTQTIVSEQDDETGQMLRALSSMVTKLNEIISEIMSGSDNIAAASTQVSSSSQQLSQGANEQASSVEEISSTMEQITTNIGQNTDNAGQTEKIAHSAQKGIEEISVKSRETLDASKLIAEKINIVTDIAFQTNILALNAAVEAARAGDSGKGFAVVAAEVRKLAEKSKVAAEEIVELTRNNLTLAELSGKKMEDILPDVEKTSSLVQEIFAASQEQNSGADQVNSAIQQLNTVVQQNAAASEELASSAEEMNGQAEQLKDLVSYFRINSTKTSFSKGKQPEKMITKKTNHGQLVTSIKNEILKNGSVSDNEFEHF